MKKAKHLGILSIYLLTLYLSAYALPTKSQRENNVLTNTEQTKSDSLTSDGIHPQDRTHVTKPDGLFTCDDLFPVYATRSGVLSQQSASPFSLEVEPAYIKPGDIAKITITTTEGQGHELRALALQVTGLNDDANDKTWGRFLQADNVNLQTCHSTDDILVYSGPEVRDHVTLEWLPSPDVEGSVQIRATVFEDERTFWVDVYSNIVKVQTFDSQELAGASDELRNAVSETLEDMDGPMESLEEVLQHQGVRTIQKIGETRNRVEVVPVKLDKELPVNEENIPEINPPETAEFIGSLLKLAGGGGGSSSGGGLSSAFQMAKGVGTVSKFMKGGSETSSTSGSSGGLLGSLLGGGGGGGGSNGGLGSLLGNLAPPPTGLPPSNGPVTITPTDEPSLADLLGVDPSTVIDNSPRASPSNNNPLSALLGGGSSGGGGGGGGLSSLLGLGARSGVGGGGGGGGGGSSLSNLASLASLAGPLSGLLGGGSKSRSTPPPLPGFGGGLGGLGGLGGAGGSNPFGFGGLSQTPSMNQIFAMMQQQQAQIAALQNQLSINSITNSMGGFGDSPLNFGQQANAQLLGIPGQSPAIRNPTPFGQFNQFPGNGFPPGNAGMNNFPMQNNFGNNQFQPNRLQPTNQFPQPNRFGNNQFGNQFGQRNNQFGQQAGNNRFGQQPNNGFGIPANNNQFRQNQLGQANQNQGNMDSAILSELMKQNGLLMEQLQHMRGSTGGQQGSVNVNRNTQSQLRSGNNMNAPQTNLGSNTGMGFPSQTPPRQNNFPNNGGMNQATNGNSPQGNGGFAGNSGFPTNNGNNNNPGNFLSPNGNSGQNNNFGNTPSGPNIPNNPNNFPPAANNGFGQSNAMPNNNNNNNAFGQNTGGNFDNNNNNFGNQQQNPFGVNNEPSGPTPSSPTSLFGQGGSSLFGGGSEGGGSSLTSMFGGGSSGGPLSSQLGGLLQGGGNNPLAGLLGGGGSGSPSGNNNPLAGLLGSGGPGGPGGNSNPLAGLLGGGAPGGPGGGADSLSSLMGSIDTSAIGNMIGKMGVDPGSDEINNLFGNVDLGSMQNMLAGEQGQDLMGSINGLLGGPQGGGLMSAMEGILSGDPNAVNSIEGLLGGSNPAELQSMAQQAENLLSQAGINPNEMMAQLMG